MVIFTTARGGLLAAAWHMAGIHMNDISSRRPLLDERPSSSGGCPQFRFRLFRTLECKLRFRVTPSEPRSVLRSSGSDGTARTHAPERKRPGNLAFLYRCVRRVRPRLEAVLCVQRWTCNNDSPKLGVFPKMKRAVALLRYCATRVCPPPD